MTLDSSLQKALEELSTDVQRFPISDLIMMQMVGEFETFLSHLDSREYEAATDIVDETRAKVTSERLFTEIANKTVEAQFGDRETAVRELGQNALDAYLPGDQNKRVHFNMEQRGKHLVLTAADRGIGMSPRSLVSNLLIPYNSLKEFDPNTVGEHGIGWWSTLDLGEYVRTTSRERGRNEKVETVVFKNGAGWEAAWASKEVTDGTPEYGTTVEVFIDKNKVSALALRNALYKHLGMVPKKRGSVVLDREVINGLNALYQSGESQLVSIEGLEHPLSIGVSNRAILGNLDDTRLRDRNRNLESVLFTQNGMFVKYGDLPFDNETIHAILHRGAVDGGMDFWVDLPENVTLTKGRNNWIADDKIPLLKAMYAAFESTYLDVILNDPAAIAQQDGKLLQSIANVFDSRYSALLQAAETGKYGIGRRIASRSSAIAVGALDLAQAGGRALYEGGIGLARGVKGCGVAVGRAAGGTARYLSTDFSGDLSKWGKELREAAPGLVRTGIRKGTKGAAGLSALAAAGYGGYRLFQMIPLEVLIYAGIAVGGTAGVTGAAYGIRKIGREIRENRAASIGMPNSPSGTWADFVEGWRNFHPLQSTRNFLEYLVHKTGLYVDMDEKREKKRKKIEERLAKKHSKSIQKDPFMARIMEKQIIDATHIYQEGQEKKPYKPYARKTRSLGQMFKSILDEKHAPPHRQQSVLQPHQRPKGAVKTGFQSEEWCRDPVKLSIDDLVTHYTKGRLQWETNRSKRGWFTADDYYWVSRDNPLANIVIESLTQVQANVYSRYDVKILEDRLNTLAAAAKKAIVVSYFVSGIGIAHLLASSILSERKNPGGNQVYYGGDAFKDMKVREVVDNIVHGIRSWYNSGGMGRFRDAAFDKGNVTARKFARGAGKVGRGLGIAAVFLPVVTYTCAKAVGTKVIVPGVKGLDPRKWDGYRSAMKQYFIDYADGIGRAFQSRQLRKEEDKRLERPTKRQKFFKFMARVATESKILGYGTLYGDRFKNISLERLATATEAVEAGQGYLQLGRVVSDLDTMIAEVLGKTPHTVVMDVKNSKTEFKTDSYDNGIWIDKDTLRIDADKTYGSARPKSFAGDFSRPEYLLLDILIHHYAHEEQGGIERVKGDLGGRLKDHYHNNQFYALKDEYRRRVIEHILENDIDLKEISDSHTPILSWADRIPDADPHYDINAQELCDIVYAGPLTKRTLKAKYEKKRDAVSTYRYRAPEKATT